MAELTEDEYTILLLAEKGKSMIPIGRWERPVDKLLEKGFLKGPDRFNNYITEAGRAALQEEQAAEDKRLGRAIEIHVEIQRTQKAIQAFIEQAANLLAQAGRESRRLDGSSPVTAAERWAKVMLDRTKDILDGE